MMPHRAARLLLLACATPLLLMAACDRSDERRCQELDDIIQARGAQMPHTCFDDIDCLLVDVHPGMTVSANSVVEDPALEQTKARRIELCGDFEEDFLIHQARCVSNACVAQVIGVGDAPVPDLDLEDAGTPDADDTPDVDDTPDADDCTCARDSDCAEGQLCADGCQCVDICQAACSNADACGQLEALRLGSDIPNCVTRCTAFIDREGDGAFPLLECLATEPCGSLSECL